MTKEDAIDIIKSECYVFNPLNFDRSTMINTALDMAVKALKQEPCDDAISRKWLKNAIHNFYKGLIHTPTEEDIQAYIDVAPSVKPQPKMGRWEWVQYDYNPKFGNWHCSECRSIFMECVDKNEKGGIPLYKYCPKCGAKMESEEV